jgi:hypothetical protein
MHRGEEWCKVVQSVAGWYRAMQDGAGFCRGLQEWCRVVHGGVGWFTVVQVDAGWCRVVRDAGWCTVVQSDAGWCGWVQSGTGLCRVLQVVQDGAQPFRVVLRHAV